MIAGQRVRVQQMQRSGEGIVVDYEVAVAANGSAVEVLERIIVQLDDGSFAFCSVREVRAVVADQLPAQVDRRDELAAQPAEKPHQAHVRDVQNRRDRRQTPQGPVCPTHKLALPSKRERGVLFCPADDGAGGFCTWSWTPERASTR